jgi:hypothetical protein
MKKTPKTTITTLPSDEANASLAPASTAAINDLPIIQIVSEEEEMHVKLELEMEDSTHDMLVKWGKEVASDEDYINIAITDGLKHGISSDNSDSLNKEDTLPLV